jgi:hypothetical protein
MLEKLQNKFLDYVYNNNNDIQELVCDDMKEASFRLAIYQHNVIYNLIGSLKLTYHLILAKIGDKAFEQLAKDYIKIHKPTSGNLDDYGAEFSSFLQRRNKLNNHKFLGDLAKFEWLKNIIYNYENQKIADLQELKQIKQELYPSLKFIFNSTVNLMKSRFNFYKIILEEESEIKKEPCYIIIYRQNYLIKTSEITKASWHFIGALMQNKNLATAYNIAIKHDVNFDLGQEIQNIITSLMVREIIIEN